MALNFPGPCQLRIFQQNDANGEGVLDHVLQLNLETNTVPSPGDLFTMIDVNLRSAADRQLDTVCDELVALLRPLYDETDTTFTHAELWLFDEGTFDATFISAYAVGLAGQGIIRNFPCSQMIYTFRSHEGGIMRVYLEEAMTAAGGVQSYADMNANNQAFVDYFTDDADSPFLARDTSYPLVFMRLLPGQSEATFKARYRP